jgi:hypothetical protein
VGICTLLFSGRIVTRPALPLRQLAAAAVIEAVSGVLLVQAAILASFYVGAHLWVIIWCVPHPLTWRYDALMFAICVAVAGAATALYGGACWMTTLTPLLFRGCSRYDTWEMGQAYVWLTVSSCALLWVAVRLVIWWHMRRL